MYEGVHLNRQTIGSENRETSEEVELTSIIRENRGEEIHNLEPREEPTSLLSSPLTQLIRKFDLPPTWLVLITDYQLIISQ